MKIKSLGRLLGECCPAVLPDQPTHPGLTFNTSVWSFFRQMVENTTSTELILKQSFIKLERIKKPDNCWGNYLAKKLIT